MINSYLQKVQRKLLQTTLGDDSKRTDGVCRNAPEWLVLCINNVCNLHCKMCDVGLEEQGTVFYANLIGTHPQNMSLALMEKILQQAESFRPKPKMGFGFTEPLIHKNILEFCRSTVGKGFYCSITTNGYRLPELADELVDLGLDVITVSVDGSEHVHDNIRGKKGSFAKLFAGVEKLNLAKQKYRTHKPNVQFSYTITDENFTDMVNFVRQIEPLNVDSLVFSHLNFISDAMALKHNSIYNSDLSVARSNLGSMNLQHIGLKDLLEELRRLKQYSFQQASPPRLTITPDLNDLAALRTYYLEPLEFVGGRVCTDPFRLMMIKTDGTVIPAHGRCYNFPVGNVNDIHLQEIWNSQRYLEFRKTLKKAGGTLPACARCCGVIGKPKTQSIL